MKVTPEDLGLAEGISHHEMLKTAKKKGLKPCPAWVGPRYRLDCADDEEVTIGMEPVPDSDDGLYVSFVDRRGDSRWLDDFDVRRPVYYVGTIARKLKESFDTTPPPDPHKEL